VAAGLPASSLGPDVLDRFASARWPAPVTAAAVEVDDDGLSPQPAITASTTRATPRAGARRRTRRSQLLTVISFPIRVGRSRRLPGTYLSCGVFGGPGAVSRVGDPGARRIAAIPSEAPSLCGSATAAAAGVRVRGPALRRLKRARAARRPESARVARAKYAGCGRDRAQQRPRFRHRQVTGRMGFIRCRR